MTDQRHDDHGPARPQVIDLDAEEIRTEPDIPAPDADESRPKSDAPLDEEPPPAAAPKRHGRGPAAWIAAALVLGAIGGAWLYRDVLSGYFPSSEMTAMKARLDAMELNDSAFADQLAALKQAADGASQAAGSAGEEARNAAQQAASALTDLDGLGGRVGALDQRIAAAEKTIGAAAADLDALRKSITAPAAPAGSGTVAGTAALAALGQRIDTLEKDVASLKASAAQGGGEDKATVTSALSQALSDLKAKIAAGTAYADEFDRISRIVPAAAGLDAVGARAADGLPNAQGLAQELRAAIASLPQPEAPAAEDDSYFGVIMKSLSGIVTIREIGEADWPGIAERAAAFAEAGDLNQAIAVIDGAEGEKPMALTQWRDRAAARLQLEAAMAQVSEAVLRQIAAMGGAQQ